MAFDINFLAGPIYVGGANGQKVWWYQTADATAVVAAANYFAGVAAPAPGHRNMQVADVITVMARASMPAGAGQTLDHYIVTAISAAGAATAVKTTHA